jgi:hypothetical protein
MITIIKPFGTDFVNRTVLTPVYLILTGLNLHYEKN